MHRNPKPGNQTPVDARMRRLSITCVPLLMILSACSRHIDPEPPTHSTASVIVEESAVTPGSKVSFGIQFVTEPGWHIYWQNPGDSGEPPRINWQLPVGMTAGMLEWPTPMRLTTPAGTDYGYEGTTILLSSLQVPANAQPGEMSITGDLRWLVCRDICIPQRTQILIPLRVAHTTIIDESAQKSLQSAAEPLPKSLPDSMRPVAASTADGFRLTLVSKDAIAQAQFFPSEEEQVDNAAPQELTTRAGRTSLMLKKSQYLRREPGNLRGVLVLNGKDAYQVDVPLQKGSH